MPDDPNSRLDLVKYGAVRETVTKVLEADNMSIRDADDGGLIVELFREGTRRSTGEGYQMHFCQEDVVRLKEHLTSRTARN